MAINVFDANNGGAGQEEMKPFLTGKSGSDRAIYYYYDSRDEMYKKEKPFHLQQGHEQIAERPENAQVRRCILEGDHGDLVSSAGSPSEKLPDSHRVGDSPEVDQEIRRSS